MICLLYFFIHTFSILTGLLCFHIFSSRYDITLWYNILRHNKTSQVVAEMFTPYFETSPPDCNPPVSSTVQASPDTPQTSLMCSHSHGVGRVGWCGWVHQNKNKESRIFVTALVCRWFECLWSQSFFLCDKFIFFSYSSLQVLIMLQGNDWIFNIWRLLNKHSSI